VVPAIRNEFELLIVKTATLNCLYTGYLDWVAMLMYLSAVTAKKDSVVKTNERRWVPA
jgi:hypothetical protein